MREGGTELMQQPKGGILPPPHRVYALVIIRRHAADQRQQHGKTEHVQGAECVSFHMLPGQAMPDDFKQRCCRHIVLVPERERRFRVQPVQPQPLLDEHAPVGKGVPVQEAHVVGNIETRGIKNTENE